VTTTDLETRDEMDEGCGWASTEPVTSSHAAVPGFEASFAWLSTPQLG